MNDRRSLIGSALLVLLVRIATAPRTLWELDEILFTEAVVNFDPLRHHPHPPGYPLLVGLGKLIAFVVGDPFFSLVTMSVLASVVGFVALALAFEEISASRRVGIAGSLLVHLSPALLVHGPLALSDPPALMFLSLMLFSGARFERVASTGDAVATAVFASAAIGCRPQYAIAIVPLFLISVGRQWFVAQRAREAGWRVAAAALAAFTAACLVWLVPLVLAVGGPKEWIAYELHQASYVAQHDAVISRSGWTASGLVQRFVAHPWGPKWLSLPLLGAAVAGALLFARTRRLWAAIPLLGIATLQLAFCLISADPADGVRYVLPWLYAVGFLAAVAIDRLRAATWFVTGALVAAFGIYAFPVVAPRVVSPSPPAQAAAFLRTTYGPDAIVLFESSLRPHAQWFLRDFNRLPWDRGVVVYANRPDATLAGLADGASDEPDARTFAWPESDAWGKLTRNHYRVVSVVPVPPRERFRVLAGVHALERDPRGVAWRWLEESAVLEMADLPSQTITVELRLPPEHPREAVDVEVAVGEEARRLTLRRGETATAAFPDTPGDTRVDVRCRGSIVPGQIEGSLNRDPRSLCVQLARIAQH